MNAASTPVLFGHDEIKSSIMEAYYQNRLPHALLFSGPQGVGKATFAYHCARWLLSGAPRQFEVLSDDPLFKRVASGAHGDFFALSHSYEGDRPAKIKSMSIDHVRHFLEQLSKTPLEGGWRIALVDSLNDLNRSGANALLKTLEEPRQKTLLIIIHHEGEALLPTIRSRCHKISFRRLSLDQTVDVMKHSDTFSGREIPVSLASLARGRPGMLIHLDARLGEGDYYTNFMHFIKALSSGNSPEVMGYIRKILSDSKVEHTFSGLDCFEWLWWWFQGELLSIVRGDMEHHASNREARREAEVFLEHWTVPHITAFASMLSACIKRLRTFHLNEVGMLTDLFLNFMCQKK